MTKNIDFSLSQDHSDWIDSCKSVLEEIDRQKSNGLLKVVGNPMDLAQINKTWYLYLRFRQPEEFYLQLEWNQGLVVKSLRSHPRGKIALIFGYGND